MYTYKDVYYKTLYNVTTNTIFVSFIFYIIQFFWFFIEVIELFSYI